MQKKLDTIQVNATIVEALNLFKTIDHSELPVIDNKKLVGLLAREDIIKAATIENNDTINKIYKKNPISVYNTDELKLAIELLEHYKLYCLPIKAKDSTLLGILTRTDIFKTLINL